MAGKARKATATTRRTTKKLPATLWSALGPVEVRETSDGLDDDLGEWDAEQRIVRVRPGIHPKTSQHTLYHEWVHLLLWDAGLTVHFPPNLEELVCDTIATALVATSHKH